MKKVLLLILICSFSYSVLCQTNTEKRSRRLEITGNKTVENNLNPILHKTVKNQDSLFKLDLDLNENIVRIIAPEKSDFEFPDCSTKVEPYKFGDFNADDKEDIMVYLGACGTGGCMYALFLKQFDNYYKLAFMDYLKNMEFKTEENGCWSIESSEETEPYNASNIQITIFKFDTTNYQYKLDTTYIYNEFTDTTKIVELGYNDTYDKLPKLTFDQISEAEFNSFHSKNFIQKLKIEEKDNSFFIQTSIQKHTFKKYTDYGGDESWSGYEFLGYYPALKLYALTKNATSEHIGFGELFLLDSINDYQYNIISFGDGSVELPIPSNNYKYLVYYYNSVYKHKNCDIGVLKINDKLKPQNYLTEFSSFHSDEFKIEKIVWKSDHSFYVKGYEEIYENKKWIKKYNYYKTVFE